jgi:hypothetical protein
MPSWSNLPEGQKDAGHESEIIDLYAIKFNPVLTDRDVPNWANESIPMQVLEDLDLKKRIPMLKHEKKHIISTNPVVSRCRELRVANR